MTHSRIRVRPARTSDVRSIQAIRQPGTGFNMGVDGVINSVSLIVQSDELSLSPMSFDWSPNGKIYCKVKDGNGNFVKSFDFSYPNVTLADALYCANQHFPEWKKRREEKLVCIRNQRVGELLAPRNWRTQDAQTANATYVQLKELDAAAAENRGDCSAKTEGKGQRADAGRKARGRDGGL